MFVSAIKHLGTIHYHLKLLQNSTTLLSFLFFTEDKKRTFLFATKDKETTFLFCGIKTKLSLSW
jgi:hypothetical protein